MLMIEHPVVFHRDFHHDFPPLEEEESFKQRCQSVALAALPLLGLHRPFRGPLSVVMSGLRTVTHGYLMVEHLKRGNLKEGAFHLFHTALAVAAVVLFFLRPVYTFLFSSVSDFILNSRQLVESLRKEEYRAALEAFAFMSLDVLFIISFCYGLIEITVACMVLQIILDFYLAAKHFREGHTIEGVCQLILGGGHVYQAIPQMKLMQWTWNHKPEFTAELKQDERGFVYLDLPDEDLIALHELYKEANVELPPYFGKGRAGAHVSVMSVDEVSSHGGFRVQDVGKKFTFRIVNVDSVKHYGFKGMDKVHYLTLACPQLESLRARYGLDPKMDGHDFHLTFGIQRSAS